MATINFIIRGKKSISYRFVNGRNGLDLIKAIPFIIDPKDFNKRTQQFKNNLDLNRKLLDFKVFTMEEVNNALSNRVAINSIWLKKVHNDFFNPITISTNVEYNPSLLEYINTYSNQVTTSDNTQKKLGTLKFWIKNIDTIKLKDVNLDWMTEFTKTALDNKYAESSVKKQIQLIKQIIRHAILMDIDVDTKALTFKSPKPSTISHYLNKYELELVFNFKTTNKSLENTRRLFLIGCTTGLRISDLMKIKTFNIENDMIELTTQKTKQNILIPINPRIKGFISDVKPLAHPVFNRNIKNLFKAIKLNTIVKGYVKGKGNKRVLGMYPKHMLMTSHVMRRSFASNLYGKLSTVVIMAVTGHTTEKSFLTYIKKPQRHFAEELRDFYNN